MEARGGIEPPSRGFAVPGLTTWLPRLKIILFRKNRIWRQFKLKESICCVRSCFCLLLRKICFRG